MAVGDKNRERGMHVVAAVAVTVAALGFLTGTASEPPQGKVDFAPEGSAPPTPGYRDLRSGRRGPNADLYDGSFARLRDALSQQAPDRPVSAEERERAIAARMERRAYVGAPPTIPHAIDEIAIPSCIACHGEGAKVGDVIAPKMSHEPYASCTQCHAPAVERLAVGETMQPGANLFEGMRRWGPGDRAHAGAPPVIPHPTHMRGRCDSCHGPTGPYGLKTPHPEQVSCEQCHASSAELDQRPPFMATGAP